MAARAPVNPTRNHEKYGRGVCALGEQSAIVVEPQLLVEQLRERFHAADYSPPVLPATALELLELTRRPDVQARQIRALLDREPLLAARVLRIAQSPVYRGTGIISLEEAIARLGLQTVGDLFLQEALRAKVFRVKGYDRILEHLVQHSIVTAHIARAICNHTYLPTEYAFLCGLLHDIGLVAGIHALAELGADPQQDQTQLLEALVEAHVEAGVAVANAWQLPGDVQLVIGMHHHFRSGGHAHPLAAAICLADWLATEEAARIAPDSMPACFRAACSPLEAADAVRELGLSEHAVATVRQTAAELCQQV